MSFAFHRHSQFQFPFRDKLVSHSVQWLIHGGKSEKL